MVNPSTGMNGPRHMAIDSKIVYKNKPEQFNAEPSQEEHR